MLYYTYKFTFCKQIIIRLHLQNKENTKNLIMMYKDGLGIKLTLMEYIYFN